MYLYPNEKSGRTKATDISYIKAAVSRSNRYAASGISVNNMKPCSLGSQSLVALSHNIKVNMPDSRRFSRNNNNSSSCINHRLLGTTRFERGSHLASHDKVTQSDIDFMRNSLKTHKSKLSPANLEPTCASSSYQTSSTDSFVSSTSDRSEHRGVPRRLPWEPYYLARETINSSKRQSFEHYRKTTTQLKKIASLREAYFGDQEIRMLPSTLQVNAPMETSLGITDRTVKGRKKKHWHSKRYHTSPRNQRGSLSSKSLIQSEHRNCDNLDLRISPAANNVNSKLLSTSHRYFDFSRKNDSDNVRYFTYDGQTGSQLTDITSPDPVKCTSKKQDVNIYSLINPHSSRYTQNKALDMFVRYVEMAETKNTLIKKVSNSKSREKNVLKLSDFFTTDTNIENTVRSEASNQHTYSKSRLVRFKPSHEVREYKPWEPVEH